MPIKLLSSDAVAAIEAERATLYPPSCSVELGQPCRYRSFVDRNGERKAYGWYCKRHREAARAWKRRSKRKAERRSAETARRRSAAVARSRSGNG